MIVWIATEYDIFQSASFQVLCGVYKTKINAITAAKKPGKLGISFYSPSLIVKK
ncbi:hypothetical protein A359_04630 [secondary endosymbiont of Ctenarytaina eucalypti]|uniref:Uncharacterized protein n=1 Tax=secondary endosymbiont of Ctenarytaina eucalypti TaxID=1199245 RepID=J3VSA2_9ENTR|nr:hypothetical protein A359_04630 [secondary endosymbiont of Ctenarytaina eucalypti]